MRACVCECESAVQCSASAEGGAGAHDALYSPPAGQLEAALQKGLGTLPEKGQPPGLSQFTSVTYSLAPGAVPVAASSVARSAALVAGSCAVGRGSPPAVPATCVPCPPGASRASM